MKHCDKDVNERNQGSTGQINTMINNHILYICNRFIIFTAT